MFQPSGSARFKLEMRVHRKDGHRDTPRAGPAQDEQALPLEVFLPAVPSWIEEDADLAVPRVQPRQIRALVEIAEGANARPLSLTEIDPHLRFR